MTQNEDGTGERDLVKTFLSRGKKIRLLKKKNFFSDDDAAACYGESLEGRK
jgi:hypothetical protein